MFNKILLPIDHVDPSSWSKALGVASTLAEQNGASLSVVSVIPEIIKLPNLPANYGDGAKAHVTEAVEKILSGAGVQADVTVVEGSVYREILKAAHAQGVDLIVIASSKGEFPDYPLGPNVARVTRHANCSVFVVRG